MKTLFIITALVAFHTLAQATKTTDTNKTVLTTVQSVLSVSYTHLTLPTSSTV